MADSTLIVPVQLDALVVNKGVAAREGDFRWWQFNYQALSDFKSPEPEAFEHQTGGAAKEGVYLHWTLPRALRSGEQTGMSGSIDYPQVPNRWLVVRMHGTPARTPTAWVIESDCPLTPQVTEKFPAVDVSQMSLYLVDPSIVESWKNCSDPFRNSTTLDPDSTDPLVANLGVSFPLTDAWSERAADCTFLTAVAPGNPVFSVYYPHNVGVFSMYDDLAGIDADTLSYLVVGWYSNPADDIMASWQHLEGTDPYSELLDSLQWTVAGDPAEKATKSLYEGLSLSIDWQRTGDPPQQDPLQDIRDSGKLNVSIGNTTIDAFSAIIGAQLVQAKHPTQTLKLLRAFQYDLLPVVNQVNGDALLEEQIRQAWFGSEVGGYWWEIVARESDGSAGTELTTDEAAWLTQLNQDQYALDSALLELFSLQWQFNAAWWKLGLNPDGFFPPIDGAPTNAQLEKYLDPANSSGITGQLVDQFQAVNGFLGLVPQPDFNGAKTAQDAFQQGISAFAEQKQLTDAKVLKTVAAPRFWQPNNPVVLLAGLEPSPASDPDESLQVRLAVDLTAGFEVDKKPATASTVGSALPALQNAGGLPSEIAAIMTEFFFVDPANAAAIASAIGVNPADVTSAMTSHSASNYSNPLPAFGLAPWSQPWNPMYLEWKANYSYIPYTTGNNQNWSFDGTDYVYTPQGGSPKVESRDIGGISLLSPNAQFVFRRRLEDFLKKYPNADLTQLDEWIGQIDDWQFLAQELTGMNELQSLRDTRAFRRPGPSDRLGTGAQQVSVADLAGFPNDQPPGATVLPAAYEGHVNSTPYLPNGPVIPFQGVRQGQMYFEQLSLYDKFGRQLWVIELGQSTGLFDAKNFPLVVDSAFEAKTKLFPDIASVVQLPPRLLQSGRLDFRLADGKDDSKLLGLDAGVNPIAGWLLPNHLDNSILIYAPDGKSLGEFRLFAQDDGSMLGQWEAPPHSDIASLDDVGRAAPHLKEMLEVAEISQPANFETFMQVIDETLWTIDPLGNRDDQNLSVLVGRPLAVVRARLQFQTHGPPLRDTSWASTLDPPVPDFINFDFGIRLGDQATRHDGVIGYFTGNNYQQFNSVVAPQTKSAQDYVKQIGPVGDQNGNFLNLQFNDQSYQYVTLLADPRASMHAVTGLLPIKQADIPAFFVERALTNIEIGFHMGPILTRVQPTPTQGGVTPAHATAISYPSPTEQNGIWSWWERNTDEPPWVGYDLLNTTTNAQLEDTPNTLREGVLQLMMNLDKPSTQG